MSRLKTLALLLLGAFLAFAPPGTLILLAALIGSWFGWEVAAIFFLVACVMGIRWIVIRARRAHDRPDAKDDHPDHEPKRWMR